MAFGLERFQRLPMLVFEQGDHARVVGLVDVDGLDAQPFERLLAGKSDEGGGHVLRQLALAAGQRELAAEALSLIAHEHWVLGEHDLAIRFAEDAFALVADAEPSRTKAQVRVALSNRLWISGREDEGLELGLEGLAEAEALGAEDVAANALRGIGTIRAGRGDESGLSDLERSVELGEKLSDPLIVHLSLNNLANMQTPGYKRQVVVTHPFIDFVRSEAGEAPPAPVEPTTTEKLLTEIRDALKK